MRKAAWTETDLAKLKRMIAAGASAARIAVLLRRTQQSTGASPIAPSSASTVWPTM